MFGRAPLDDHISTTLSLSTDACIILYTMCVDAQLSLLHQGMAGGDLELHPVSAAALADAWQGCIQGLGCSTGSFHTAHKGAQEGTATRSSAELDGGQQVLPGAHRLAGAGLHTLRSDDSMQTTEVSCRRALTFGSAGAMATTQEETGAVTPTKHPLHCTQGLCTKGEARYRHMFQGIACCPASWSLETAESCAGGIAAGIQQVCHNLRKRIAQWQPADWSIGFCIQQLQI